MGAQEHEEVSPQGTYKFTTAKPRICEFTGEITDKKTAYWTT